MVEYKVIQLREGIIGDKMSAEKLQKALNREAKDGWKLNDITPVTVKGRVGPGGVDGILITFGVSTAYVSRRLSGEVALTVGDVAAVAAVLGTSVADLVAGVPKEVG